MLTDILQTGGIVSLRHSVPDVLITQTSIFSSRLRAKNAINGESSSGLFIYREIVRENIHGVLLSVFPLFFLRLHEADIHELVNDFIYHHNATQPEFHQIATELLVFIRQQDGLSANDLALLEYEWLLYAVEIDDNDVPAPKKTSLRSAELHNASVIWNPTLKIVGLPFYIGEGKQEYEQASCLHYYAIYRKYNNCLYRKKITSLDVQLLHQVKEDESWAGILLNRKTESDESLIKWLRNKIKEEILFL
ncbi:hypothetical protein FJ881_23560 [Escherichia albertii]|nr:hypothetical protein [Escherichia albertii]EFB1502843.1 hypothetical protein [Escherichia albertii]EFO1266247.1 hypothetical protein [Escherichia albertii]QTA05183.1 hypothetical protein FYK23_00320 [Escherichia albertii]QTA14338.1 hypothetical protein FYK20_26095 [Escherichia albertii]